MIYLYVCYISIYTGTCVYMNIKIKEVKVKLVDFFKLCPIFKVHIVKQV